MNEIKNMLILVADESSCIEYVILVSHGIPTRLGLRPGVIMALGVPILAISCSSPLLFFLWARSWSSFCLTTSRANWPSIS